MITRTSHFVGELRIPNLEGVAPLDLGNSEELNMFINKYEPKILIKLLGFELYKEMLTVIDPTTGDVISGSDEKWFSLVDGKDDYLGLRPILSNYIFAKFIKNDDSHYGGVGVVKEKSKGAENYSSRSKYINAYREYYELAVGKIAPIEVIRTRLGIGVVWSSSAYDTYKPLRVFLDENEELFPNKVNNFNSIKNDNFYGI
jgi:hypothetical protein